MYGEWSIVVAVVWTGWHGSAWVFVRDVASSMAYTADGFEMTRSELVPDSGSVEQRCRWLRAMRVLHDGISQIRTRGFEYRIQRSSNVVFFRNFRLGNHHSTKTFLNH
jgi:hypothetical protein